MLTILSSIRMIITADKIIIAQTISSNSMFTVKQILKNMHLFKLNKRFSITMILVFSLMLAACSKESIKDGGDKNDNPVNPDYTVFLVIDEESIDNGNPPNNFSETDVNDHISDIGQRRQLQYFLNNTGKIIDLYTGEVGDEGWFAIRSIPASWKSTGPANNGLENFLHPGPGLGAGNPDDDREVLLDKIPDVTPLRAIGLAMLKGQTISAVVYDSDISINYSPLEGNLMGENPGMVSFKVLDVVKRTDGSSSSLPKVTVKILNVDETKNLPIKLFMNAPVPSSSSEPFDISPPAAYNPVTLTDAP